MLTKPLDRPPAPHPGDDFKIEVRIALQPPDDCRNALLLRREKSVNEIATGLFIEMVEIAIMKSPRPAPRRIDPLGTVCHHLARCDAGQGLAAARHNAFGRRSGVDVGCLVETLSKTAAEASVTLGHHRLSHLKLFHPAAIATWQLGLKAAWRGLRCHVATGVHRRG